MLCRFPCGKTVREHYIVDAQGVSVEIEAEGEWLCFIYAVPVSLITVLVFNSIWGNRRNNYLIISFLLWSLLTTVFLQMLSYHLWMVYLLGIPVQIAVILWSQLKKQE